MAQDIICAIFQPTFISNSPGVQAARDLAMKECTLLLPSRRLLAERAFLQANLDGTVIAQMARFSTDVFQICGLVMRTKEGLSLIADHPAIGYLVALNNVFMKPCAR